MSVRAKMQCTSIIPGQRGNCLYLSAVWEGSEALQKISENAIFGDATPSGGLQLVSDALRTTDWTPNEEYYIDLLSFDPAEQAKVRTVPMVMVSARLVYRSALDPNMPSMPISFRWAIDESTWSGQLDMSIKNPGAIAWLDEHERIELSVRLARGRRSDAEIAVLQAMFDQEAERAEKIWSNPPSYYDPKRAPVAAGAPDATKAYFVCWMTSNIARKLAIARGEVL